MWKGCEIRALINSMRSRELSSNVTANPSTPSSWAHSVLTTSLSRVRIFFKRGVLSVMTTWLPVGGMKGDKRNAPFSEMFVM
jgi:hypothetical protein